MESYLNAIMFAIKYAYLPMKLRKIIFTVFSTCIQDLWTKASRDLWKATYNRAYFGEISIIVPNTWAGNYKGSQKLTYSSVSRSLLLVFVMCS